MRDLVRYLVRDLVRDLMRARGAALPSEERLRQTSEKCKDISIEAAAEL